VIPGRYEFFPNAFFPKNRGYIAINTFFKMVDLLLPKLNPNSFWEKLHSGKYFWKNLI